MQLHAPAAPWLTPTGAIRTLQRAKLLLPSDRAETLQRLALPCLSPWCHLQLLEKAHAMPGLESAAADVREAIPREVSGERGGHTKESGLSYGKRGESSIPWEERCKWKVKEGEKCCLLSVCSLSRRESEEHKC